MATVPKSFRAAERCEAAIAPTTNLTFAIKTKKPARTVAAQAILNGVKASSTTVSGVLPKPPPLQWRRHVNPLLQRQPNPVREPLRRQMAYQRRHERIRARPKSYGSRTHHVYERGGTGTSDYSGGSCGCAYLKGNNPAHCPSNAMFEAPDRSEFGTKSYGAAAISEALGMQHWDPVTGPSSTCGACFKVRGTSILPDTKVSTPRWFSRLPISVP